LNEAEITNIGYYLCKAKNKMKIPHKKDIPMSNIPNLNFNLNSALIKMPMVKAMATHKSKSKA